MGRYMEAIYLGSSGDGYKAGVSAEFATDTDTTEAFESARCHDIDINEAEFIIDLHEDNGDIVDTIGVSAESYTQITGEPALTEAEYKDIDRGYWNAARANYKAS